MSARRLAASTLMAHRALGPAGLAVYQAVRAALLPTDRRLVVACSGGADSLALAAATAQLARQQELTLLAAVVDHGLQPGSDRIAACAAQSLHALGYAEVRVERVQVGQSGGPEAAARTARYRVLERLAEGGTVLLGHTLDDQAETVLLGLARGSGTRSLAGMAMRTHGAHSGQASYLRPMLGLRRAVTRAACIEQALDYWDDPHNSDARYARSRVRHRVLPMLEAELGPGIAEALARTAQLARNDADLLDQLAADLEPGDTLDCAELSTLPAALRSRVIRSWLVDRGARDVTSSQVAAVDSLITDWRGQGAVALAGLKVIRATGQLRPMAG